MIAASKSNRCHVPPKVSLANVDPLTARVFQVLGRVLHLNRLVATKMGAHRGFQPQEAFALGFVRRNEGVSQRELAAALHLSHPRVSMILQRLEERGVVERRADDSDRRLARIFLTGEGRRLEEEQRTVLGEYVGRTIGALSEADRKDLERILGELGDRIAVLLQEELEPAEEPEEAKTR